MTHNLHTKTPGGEAEGFTGKNKSFGVRAEYYQRVMVLGRALF
jgi:hypothetical protein